MHFWPVYEADHRWQKEGQIIAFNKGRVDDPGYRTEK